MRIKGRIDWISKIKKWRVVWDGQCIKDCATQTEAEAALKDLVDRQKDHPPKAKSNNYQRGGR